MTCKRFVVSVFLGLFLSFVYTNTVAAQSVPPGVPTPNTPPIPSVHIVGALDAWYGGWAANLSAPDQPIDVAFEMETIASPSRLVGVVQTNVLRPDVNAAFGIAGNHGFNLTDGSQICDGVEHFIRAYAINPYTGERVELPVSSPNANKVKCGTRAARISFTAKNRFNRPVTSNSWNEAMAVMLRINQWGIAEFFAQTTIDEQGAGGFNEGPNGENMLSDSYEVWILAKGYLANAKSRQRFAYNRAASVSLTFQLDKAPVFIESQGGSSVMPSNGEYFQVPLRICNLDFTPHSIPMGNSAEFHITISGPGKTSLFNTSRDQVWYLAVPPDPGTCYVQTLYVQVDAALPDGQQYCAYIKATEFEDPDSVWSETVACAYKGAREDLGALKPNKG